MSLSGSRPATHSRQHAIRYATDDHGHGRLGFSPPGAPFSPAAGRAWFLRLRFSARVCNAKAISIRLPGDDQGGAYES